MTELHAVVVIVVVLVAGVALDRIVRRPRRRGSRDQRLAERLDAASGHDVDLVEELLANGWLWPRSAGGERPQRRLETGRAARLPARHARVEVVGTVVRNRALRGSPGHGDFTGASVAVVRLPSLRGGQALFVEGGTAPDALEGWLRHLPKVADLRYVDGVAEAAHGVDSLLDLAWSTWAPKACSARKWLADDQALREALRAAAPGGITIGRGLPADPVHVRRLRGAAGRALRSVRAIEVRDSEALVVSSGSPAQAADAAEAFVSLL